ELLLPADERVQPLVILGERREDDALRRLRDLDPVGGDGGVARDVEVKERLDLRRRRAGESLRVETGEIGEAPMLLGRVRKRQRLVGGGGLRSTHTACTGGGEGCDCR